MRFNRAVGVATVRSTRRNFARRARSRRRSPAPPAMPPIGRMPRAVRGKPAWCDVRLEPSTGASPERPPARGDQLSGLRWDMAMIGATPSGSYAAQPGSHAVRVGVMDTGVAGSHPDIAPNLDRELSGDFTVDSPLPGIDDGPCEMPTCKDPAASTTTVTAPTSRGRSAQR